MKIKFYSIFELFLISLIMPTLSTILKMLSKYHLKGSFETKGKTKLSDIFSPNPIPKDLDNYGVYLIVDKNDEIVYIGKSGTIKQNGEFGNHTLSRRIMQGKPWLKGKNYTVYWFVTIKNKKGKLKSHISTYNLPSVVECELLRKFYKLERCLPEHNSAF